jgi:hypothetical protein
MKVICYARRRFPHDVMLWDFLPRNGTNSSPASSVRRSTSAISLIKPPYNHFIFFRALAKSSIDGVAKRW